MTALVVRTSDSYSDVVKVSVPDPVTVVPSDSVAVAVSLVEMPEMLEVAVDDPLDVSWSVSVELLVSVPVSVDPPLTEPPVISPAAANVSESPLVNVTEPEVVSVDVCESVSVDVSELVAETPPSVDDSDVFKVVVEPTVSVRLCVSLPGWLELSLALPPRMSPPPPTVAPEDDVS